VERKQPSSEFLLWLGASIDRLQPRTGASMRTLALAVFGGVVADRTLESGTPGIGLTVFSIALAVVVLVMARGETAQARWFAAVAAVLSLSFLAFNSIWVVDLSAVGVVASLLVAASLLRGGDILDLSWGDVTLRAATGCGHSLLVIPWLGKAGANIARGLGASRRRPVVRSVLLAVPLVTILGLLLGAADPLFASLFNVSVDASLVGFHTVLVSVGALTLATLVRIAKAGEMPDKAPINPPHPGSTEGLVVLGSLTILFAHFAATQVAAAYSDYARSGYFQLIAVVIITTMALPLLRTMALEEHRHSRWIRTLCAAVVLLTVGIGVVAMRRLWLYDDAYGLTMLRLGSTAAAAWFGVLLLLLGASVLGVAPKKSWFPGTALISLLVFIAAFAVFNPEAYVARYNVTHVQHVGLDTAYLSSLSADAVPDLATAVSSLAPPDAAALRVALCERGDSAGSWSTWTLSRASAAAALRKLCTG
jgi:hypothetical protein